MSHSQKQQQDRQRDLQQKLEELAPQIETMVTRMLGSAEKVDQTLQNADARILGFGGGNTRYIIPGMVYSAIVLRLGGENWRTMVGTGLGLGVFPFA